MRSLLRLMVGGVALAAAVALPGSAVATPFTGTFELQVGTLPAAQFPGSGSGTSTASLVTVPASVFVGTVTTPVTGNPPVTEIRVIVQNEAGSFAGTPLGGLMPVIGAAKVRGLEVTIADVPLFQTSGGVVTAGLGVGGTIILTGIVNTINFGPWTVATATVQSVPYQYHLATGAMASQTTTTLAPETRMGYDNRTEGGLGTVQLVSPTRVTTSLTPPLAVWSTLTLKFEAPEPAAALLSGAAVLTLLGLGAWRMRRS